MMSIRDYYRYVDCELVDTSLICDLCENPFVQPVIVPCQKKFCRQCVENGSMLHEGNCSECSGKISKDQLISVTDQSFLDQLDSLLVQCLLCEETNLKQSQITAHIHHQCPKAVVTCSDQCPWIGLREEISSHSISCPMRSTDHTLTESPGYFLPFARHYLEKRHFHNQDIAIAVKALIINKRCRDYDLFHRNITSDSAALIASVLENDSLVQTLDLRNNFICDSGIQYFCHALSTGLNYIHLLDLNENALTDIGVRLLADMLKVNKRLSKLRLAFNRITSEGANMLMDVLNNDNQTLRWLSLAGNSAIDDACAHSVIQLLRQTRSSALTLNVEYCSFSWWTKQRFYFYRIFSIRSNVELLF